ncbi:MAG: hypothetical protein NC313_00340 [Butyrivibrio sp.]|nr:hypothetical protein [Butyrivibrio sp.]
MSILKLWKDTANSVAEVEKNMYKHHEESIENMKKFFRNQGAVALILIGSVAKGTERKF